jgi:predicted NAD-dependent protein-ADP-ribosyltransferase YbiA (DUF1768 family)
MKLLLKKGIVVIIPDDEASKEEAKVWIESYNSHVFKANLQENGTIFLYDLGDTSEVIPEPVNISSQSNDLKFQIISNLSHTPFMMDEKNYESIEGFWQGLKFENEEERLRIAKLHGIEAKQAGYNIEQPEKFIYNGIVFSSGCYEHWQLMKKACLSKFTQNEKARQALLSTGNCPIVHITKRDSKTIPGVIMSDIWMKTRKNILENKLRNQFL